MSINENVDFNFNDAVQDIMNGKNISGKDGVLACKDYLSLKSSLSYPL